MFSCKVRPATYLPHSQRIQQEAGKLQSGGVPQLRILQLLQDPWSYPLQTGDGSGHLWFYLDNRRPCGYGRGMKEIAALIDAVEVMHGCKARHKGSKAVKEIFQGETEWQGKRENERIKSYNCK